MSKSDLEFFAFSKRKISPLLEKAFSVKKKATKINVLDLGCGEGAMLEALARRGLLDDTNITAIDISPRLISIAKKRFKKRAQFIKTDVVKTNLPKSRFDLVYSTMVIEHIENPKEMVSEIYRILKPQGVVFISTIVKKWWGIYFYRNKGKFVVDPTHLHEFESPEELVELMKDGGFEVIEQITFPRYYSLLELLIKLLIRLNIISPGDEVRRVFSRKKYSV